ncbi:hypothetical protein ES319_A10G133400v1 [Gossypium barbadense]|uniref:Integrase catalytic domain-containing protein n=1 Tax=Gossypium barbadense TaxID=3634 RepID=A0A5J5U2H4_GOSBA|nr:hypothetical protein ES319_A10G133400v1 [Gossypium barbadense]
MFLTFKTHVELQLGVKIKQLQTDGGGEFRTFDSYLNGCGIAYQLTCLHMTEENRIVERCHRQIVETGLVLPAQASLPLSYWLMILFYCVSHESASYKGVKWNFSNGKLLG